MNDEAALLDSLNEIYTEMDKTYDPLAYELCGSGGSLGTCQSALASLLPTLEKAIEGYL